MTELTINLARAIATAIIIAIVTNKSRFKKAILTLNN